MINVDWSIVFQIINFIVLVLLLVRFLFKPAVQALESRSKHIEEQISAAEAQKKAAEELRMKLEEAEQKIQERYLEMIEEANTEAAKVKEAEKLYSQLREEIVEIVETVVVKILTTQIAPEVQTQLIDRLLEEAGSQIEEQMEVSYEK